MKSLFILAIALLGFCTGLQAHSGPGYGAVAQQDHSSFGTTVAINGYFHLNDSTTLSDSLYCYLPDSFVLDSFDFIDSASTFGSGDSVAFTAYLSFQHSVLPYFYQEVLVAVQCLGHEEQEELAAKAFVFFTPWNHLEVWGEKGFYNCGRRWHHPEEYSSPPVRTFIAPQNLPLSSYQDVAANREEWELDYHDVTLPNLPFDLKMAAYHPDTIDSLAHYFGDHSTWADPNDSTAFSLLPAYVGTVKGRLTSTITNDLGVQVVIPLSGILVQLKERDAYFHELFGETHTDANGNFSINYAREQAWENGAIELYICTKAKSKTHNFVVSNNWLTDISVSTTAENRNFNIGSTPQNAGTTDMGTIDFQSPAFWMCHWVENAYRYADEEGVGVLTEKLKVLMNSTLATSNFAPGALFGSAQFTFLNSAILTNRHPTIRMEARQLFDENTIYHEWGHYYLWALQSRNYIDLYNYDGLFHTWSEEQHSRLAWSEGFADAMQFILDAHYWEDDDEYNFEGQFSVQGAWLSTLGDRFEQRRQYSNGVNDNINSGFNSEYYFACALYDLWDGADKGLPDPTNGGVIPGSITHPWSDRFAAPGYVNWTEEDNVSLDFADLMQPILDNSGTSGKLHNIYEYFDYLINNVYSDCETRQAISACLFENDILLDIDTKINTGQNTGMSTDGIRYTEVINDRGWNLTAGLADGFITNWNDLINGTRWNFLAINPAQWPLHDDFVTYQRNYFEANEGALFRWDENGGVMTDNYRLGYAFPAPAVPSSFQINILGEDDFNVSTCGDVLLEVNNTEFTIGSGSSGAATTFTLNEGAHMVLDGESSLRIQNNCRLVVEEGAELTLKYLHNLELLGDNAVLEIRGKLNLGFNYVLEFTGSGKLVFNSSEPHCITFSPGSSINLVGNGPNDVVLEVHQEDLYAFKGNNFSTTSSINISDGKVLLAHNSRLAVDYPISLQNVTFDRLSAGNRPRGLYVYGQDGISIDQCTFNNSIHGLYSANFFGKQLVLTDCDFNDCTYGLFSWKNSTEILGGSFNNCAYGWYTREGNLSSYMANTSISGCGEGIFFMGNTNLHLNGVNIHDNVYRGVNFFGRSFSSWCGTISNNYTGIVGVCDELVLSHKMRPYSGYMTIEDNRYGIAFDGTYLRLNWGSNNLVSTTPLWGTNLNIAAQHESWFTAGGRMANHRVLASGNIWDKDPLFNHPDYQSIDATFTHYGNHQIDKKDPLGNLSPSTVKSYSSISSVPACPVVYDPNDIDGLVSVEDEYHNPEHGTPVLDFTLLVGHSNHEFQSQTLQDAVVTSTKELYDGSILNGYTVSTQRFADIIRVTDNENWEYAGDAYVGYLLDYAYLRMMEAFQYACIYEGAIDNGATTLLNEVLDVQQGLLADVMAVNDPTMDVYIAEFKYNLDMATTYWLVEDYANTTSILTSMQAWATGYELETVNRTLCNVNYENDVLQGIIALSEVGTGVYPCEENIILPRIVENEVTGFESPSAIEVDGFSLYPNPVTAAEVYVTFSNSRPKSCSISVFDQNGRKVWQSLDQLPNENGVFAIPVADLMNGLYFVSVEMEYGSSTNTFSIQR